MTARRLPRSIDGLTRLVFKLDEDRARLKRELESAEKQVVSNQEEITRLRHLVMYPDFNLPAALAIVKERDEWRAQADELRRRVAELEVSPNYLNETAHLRRRVLTTRPSWAARAWEGVKGWWKWHVSVW